MSLGRSSDGRLFTRDGRLCVGCCGALGDCCSYPAFTSCNGTQYEAGSYGKRFRYNFNITATVSASGQFIGNAPNCFGTPQGGNSFGSLDIQYVFSGSIDFAHSGPTSGGTCVQSGANVEGTLSAQYADGDAIADIDLAEYPDLLQNVRVTSDRPVTATWPSFLDNLPVDGDFSQFLRKKYEGFGVIPVMGIRPKPYEAITQGMAPASAAFASCTDASVPDWAKVFGSASADSSQVEVWASNFNQFADIGRFFNYRIRSNDLPCQTGAIPDCDTVEGYWFRGPPYLEFFGVLNCDGGISYEEYTTGTFTSSGNLTPTSSNYFGQFSGSLDATDYRCCSDDRRIFRDRTLIDLNMTQFVNTSVQTLEPC